MARRSYLLLLGLLACSPAQLAFGRLSQRPMDYLVGLSRGVATLSPGLAMVNSLALELLSTGPGAPDSHAPEIEQLKAKLKQAGDTEKPSPDGQAPAPKVLVDDGQLASLNTEAAIAEASEEPTAPVVHTDYRKAMSEAVESRKMLFIYFYEPHANAARAAFENLTLSHLEIQEKLKRYVVAKLPTDAKITVDGKPLAILAHASFAEMLGRPGVAVVDLCHERSEYYGHVVSTFPFTPGKYYRRQALSIILDLPPGTLTQRTMIYAVRIHPEAPASTQGQFNRVLAEEAKSHAVHQASIQVQGHHAWDARFQRINAKLPSGVLAQEVVAESWPNENLVEACVDCVGSWRQSPGHWGAVRSRHPLFGYDIKRGRNGIWYATGIFGLRRR
jgi:hypothetical protein